tara:strand:+ start:188 stop:877 length:690 start_codon:yes stop_codon:yes gene_type:complete
MKAKSFKRFKLFDAVDLQTETIDGERHYVIAPDKKYKSVTSVLSQLTKQHINEWRKKVGEEEANKISTSASNRGTKLHTFCEHYLNEDVKFIEQISTEAVANPFSQSAKTIELFNSIKHVVDEGIEIIYDQEFALYSDVLKTAGRCDLFCSFNGFNTVLDFKTSSKPKKEEWIENYFIQCTAYAMMIGERYNINVPRIAVLIAVENEPYQLFFKSTQRYKDRVLEVFCG